jgi:Protein of unknown function (DUF4239)
VILLQSFVILVGAVGVAIGALLLVRRNAPEGSYFADGDRASGVFGVLATGFAIFAGFVVFLAFTSYDQSRAGAEREALTVIQQYETAQFLPESVRPRLGSELVCYARNVVHREWPEMRSGSAGDTINPWGLALFRTLEPVEPGTAAEEAAYGKWLDQTSDREEARRDRLHGASGIIPTSVWIVLFLTAGVVFAYMLFFADSAERRRSQAMLIGSATTVLVATLLVINALDNPYGGDVGRIEPTAMERTLVLLDEARQALGSTEAPPCDDEGVAR